MIAVKKGNFDIIRDSPELYSKIDIPDNNGRIHYATVLQAAVAGGRLATIRLILSSKPNLTIATG